MLMNCVLSIRVSQHVLQTVGLQRQVKQSLALTAASRRQLRTLSTVIVHTIEQGPQILWLTWDLTFTLDLYSPWIRGKKRKFQNQGRKTTLLMLQGPPPQAHLLLCDLGCPWINAVKATGKAQLHHLQKELSAGSSRRYWSWGCCCC